MHPCIPVIVVLFLIAPRSAWPLSCAQPDEPIDTTIARAYENVDIVVIGQATAERGRDSKPQRIAVERVWKGDAPDEILVSRFDEYLTNEDQAIFARGPREGGYFLGEECLYFADISTVIDILETRYGEGRRPELARSRHAIYWYAAMLILALVGVGILVKLNRSSSVAT